MLTQGCVVFCSITICQGSCWGLEGVTPNTSL